jgi:hypothetical protein
VDSAPLLDAERAEAATLVRHCPLIIRLMTPQFGLIMPYFVMEEGRVWCLVGVPVAFGGMKGLPGISGTR